MKSIYYLCAEFLIINLIIYFMDTELQTPTESLTKNEGQTQKRKQKEKAALSSLPKEKAGLLLYINAYEVKEKLQKAISEVENSLTEKEIDPKTSLEKLKTYLPNILKDVRRISNNISKVYNLKLNDKDIQNLYEIRKVLTKVSPDSVTNFMELLNVEKDTDKEKE